MAIDVIDISPPSWTNIGGGQTDPGGIARIAVSVPGFGDVLLCQGVSGSLSDGSAHVLDIRDLGNVTTVGTLPVSTAVVNECAQPASYAARGQVLTYSRGTLGGLHVIDLSDPANPAKTYTFSVGNSGGGLGGMAIGVWPGPEDYVVLFSGRAGTFYVVDVTNPSSFSIVGSVAINANVGGQAHVIGDAAICGITSGGYQVVNVSNPAAPVAVYPSGGVIRLSGVASIANCDGILVNSGRYVTANVSDFATPLTPTVDTGEYNNHNPTQSSPLPTLVAAPDRDVGWIIAATDTTPSSTFYVLDLNGTGNPILNDSLALAEAKTINSPTYYRGDLPQVGLDAYAILNGGPVSFRTIEAVKFARTPPEPRESTWTDPRAPIGVGPNGWDPNTKGTGGGSIYEDCCDVCISENTTFSLNTYVDGYEEITTRGSCRIGSSDLFAVTAEAGAPYSGPVLAIWDLSDPSAPSRLHIGALGAGQGGTSSGADWVFSWGDYLYVYRQESSPTAAYWQVYDVSTPSAPTFEGNFTTSVSVVFGVTQGPFRQVGKYVYGGGTIFGAPNKGGMVVFDLPGTASGPTETEIDINAAYALSTTAASNNFVTKARDDLLFVSIVSSGTFEVLCLDIGSSPTAPPKLSVIARTGDPVGFVNDALVTQSSGSLYFIDFSTPSAPTAQGSLLQSGPDSYGTRGGVEHPDWPGFGIFGSTNNNYDGVYVVDATNLASPLKHQVVTVDPAWSLGQSFPLLLIGGVVLWPGFAVATFDVACPSAVSDCAPYSIPAGVQSGMQPIIGNPYDAIDLGPFIGEQNETGTFLSGGPPRYPNANVADGTSIITEKTASLQMLCSIASVPENQALAGKRSILVEILSSVTLHTDDSFTISASALYNDAISWPQILPNDFIIANTGTSNVPMETRDTVNNSTDFVGSESWHIAGDYLQDPTTSIGMQFNTNVTSTSMSADDIVHTVDYARATLLYVYGRSTGVPGFDPGTDYSLATVEGDGQWVERVRSFATDYLTYKIAPLDAAAASAGAIILTVAARGTSAGYENLRARIITGDKVIAAGDESGSHQVLVNAVPTAFCRRTIKFNYVNQLANITDLANAFVELAWETPGAGVNSIQFDYIATGGVYDTSIDCLDSLDLQSVEQTLGSGSNIRDGALVGNGDWIVYVDESATAPNMSAVDVSDRTNPVVYENVLAVGPAPSSTNFRVAVAGGIFKWDENTVIVTGTNNGASAHSAGRFAVVDVTDPTNPSIIGWSPFNLLDFNAPNRGMYRYNDLLFIGQGNIKTGTTWYPQTLWNLSSLTSPTLVDTYDASDSYNALDPPPDPLGTENNCGYVHCIDAPGDGRFFAAGGGNVAGSTSRPGGVALFDISSGSIVQVARWFDMYNNVGGYGIGGYSSLAHGGGKLYARRIPGTDGFYRYDISTPDTITPDGDLTSLIGQPAQQVLSGVSSFVGLDVGDGLIAVANGGAAAQADRSVTVFIGASGTYLTSVSNQLPITGLSTQRRMEQRGLDLFLFNGDEGGGIGRSIYGITPCSGPAIVSPISYEQGSDILEVPWGCVKVGNYILTSTDLGLSVVDVSDPYNIVHNSLHGSTARGDLTLDGTTLYISRPGSIQAVDVTDPTSPSILGSLADAQLGTASGTYVGVAGCVHTPGSVLLFTVRTLDSIVSVDVSNPASMSVLDSFSSAFMDAPYRPVYRDDGYAFVPAYNADSLVVINALNPSALSYVSRAFNSSSLNQASTVALNGNYAYVGASSRVTAVNISNINSPVIQGTPEFLSFSSSNPTHVFEIRDGYLYATMSSFGTVHIVDILTSPINPSEIAYTSSQKSLLDFPNGMVVDYPFVYVSSSNDADAIVALQVDQYAPQPSRIQHIHPITVPAFHLFKDGSDLHVASLDDYEMIDYANPLSPGSSQTILNSTVLENASDIHSIGALAATAKHSGSSGTPPNEARMVLIDGSTPAIQGSVVLPASSGGSWRVKRTATRTYVQASVIQSGFGPFQIYNTTTPGSPVLLGSFTPGSNGGFNEEFVVDGNFAYVAGSNGLWVLDISNEASIQQHAYLGNPNFEDIQHLTKIGNHVYAVVWNASGWFGLGDGGLVVYDVSNPAAPSVAATFAYRKLRQPNRITSNGVDMVYCTSNIRTVGIVAVDVSTPTAPSLAWHLEAPDWVYGDDVVYDQAKLFVDGRTSTEILTIDAT